MTPADAAILLFAARADRTLLDSDDYLTAIDLETAYEIQDELLVNLIAAGDKRIGWKIGYSSNAMRVQMHIDAPNFGPLTAGMRLDSGAGVSDLLMHPRVEPEVLFVLGADLDANCTLHQCAEAVAQTRSALEVVDSVWRDYKFSLEQNTADGSSAAHVVVGPPLGSGVDAAEIEVSISSTTGESHRGRGYEAMGNPLEALRWLAQALAGRGKMLRKGDLVLTGGLTPAIPLPEGGRVSATFAGDTQVFVRREMPVMTRAAKRLHRSDKEGQSV